MLIAISGHTPFCVSQLHPLSDASEAIFWYFDRAEVQSTCRAITWRNLELGMDEDQSQRDLVPPSDREMVGLGLPFLLLVLLILLSPLVYDLVY
jgi:hypothetical protein